MKKRLIAIFLCLLMIFALLPVAAADGDPEETAAAENSGAEEVAATETEPEETADAVGEEPEEDPDAIGSEPEEEPDANTIILINEDNFPDANFRKWIIYSIPGVKVDANGVCSITKEDAKKVTSINCSNQAIQTISGVSKFSNVQYLDCSFNKIKYLDVGSLKQLIYLNATNNVLEKVKLGSTKMLENLYLTHNKLTTISLASNVALKMLDCADNAITSLDPSPCTDLGTLVCEQNKLKELNVSKNPMLNMLNADKNALTKLDVSKNSELVQLYVNHNDLETIDVTKNPKLQYLEAGFNKLTKLDVSKNTELRLLNIDENEVTALDVSPLTKLTVLEVDGNPVKTLDLIKNEALMILGACGAQLSAIDLSKNTKLEELYLYDNHLKTLSLTHNKELRIVICDSNELQTIDVSACTKLEELDVMNNELLYLYLNNNIKLKKLACANNHMTQLELDMLPLLEEKNVSCGGQTRLAPSGIVYSGGDYKFDMSTVLSSFAKIELAVYPFNTITGYVTLPGYISSFDYLYNTGKGKMQVTLLMPYNGTASILYGSSVSYKDTTPYVVYDGKEQKPLFWLKDANGNIIDPSLYTYTFAENDKPGTGYINVTFKNTSNTAQFWFKIYLAATKNTTVENVAEGIKISWDPVPGAAGYVIYRRAWSTTTGGWTSFARWWNVTGTSWTDGTDSHKVYAGTRYQYGVKAYFAKRYDPVAGAYIGGNENIPSGNYNLGLIGPLKTTVRITTRKLIEIKSYSGKIFVKWEPSKNFTGYELQYARNAAFTQSVKTIKINKPETYGKTVDNLTAGVRYYFRIRSYHEFEGITYYGEWSNVMDAKPY